MNYQLQKLFSALKGNSPTYPNEQLSGLISPNQETYPQQNENYKPQTDIYNQLKELINQQPNRIDYKPSGWRKFAAIAGGTATGNPIQGMQLAEAIKDRPYDNATEQWQNKVKALQPLANTEEAMNANSRNARSDNYRAQYNDGVLADKDRQRDLRETELDDKRIQAEGKQKVAETNSATNARKTEAYIFKTEHPNWIPKTSESGNIIFFNPQNPSEMQDTGVKSGELSDREKLSIGLQDKLTEISAAANEARATKQVIPGKAASSTTLKPLTPSGQNRDTLNKVRDLLTQHPEFTPYIDIKTGLPKPDTRMLSGLRGPDKVRESAIASLQALSSSNQSAHIRKEIPGMPGKFAISTDGGKTWKAE